MRIYPIGYVLIPKIITHLRGAGRIHLGHGFADADPNEAGLSRRPRKMAVGTRV